MKVPKIDMQKQVVYIGIFKPRKIQSFFNKVKDKFFFELAHSRGLKQNLLYFIFSSSLGQIMTAHKLEQKRKTLFYKNRLLAGTIRSIFIILSQITTAGNCCHG